jgi:predicted membrane-bound spermidine synthase
VIRRSVFLGVALVSLGVLVLQLTLTRLFSATMYYHFAFLAISLALFGSGASGVFVYVQDRRPSAAALPAWLSLAAALFAASTVAALLVVLGNPLSPADPWPRTLARLAAIYGACALAFFFAGCVVTLAVAGFAREMGRLYFFDLAGAALGCLLLIPMLDALGAVNTVLAVSLVAALAALTFERAAVPARRATRAALLALCLAQAALLAANAQFGFLDVRHAKGLPEAGNVIFSKWNSFSRVTLWGSLENDSALIMIDADAATVLHRDGDDLARHRRLESRIEALAYRLRPGARALILGSGGGADVIMARLHGAREIVAVEVNPIIARDLMSSEPFRGYSGALYEQPGVRLVVDEGRSFIRSRADRYDVIQGTMVDTWAATSAGAFALAENNLYTVEAFEDYARHLDPDGILSLTRWHLDPPDQLLRLVSLARAMMEELAIGNPARHLMLVRDVAEVSTGRAAATFLFKRSEFTAGEVSAVEDAAARAGFTLLYTPATRPANDFTRLIEAPDPRRFWESYPNDVQPTRDDNPFFFHTTRLRSLRAALAAPAEWRKTNLGSFVLVSLLVLTGVLTLAFILAPLALARGRLLRRDAATHAALLYFACLGAGFMLVEVVLVQKSLLFLGYPVYSLAVVLFSLLVFSALGSAATRRIANDRLGSRLRTLLALVAALVVAAVLALSPLFGALAAQPRPARIAVTVLLLAPLGLAMGTPMPAGIRLLAERRSELIPWAWGVNGAASVLGSVAALALALAVGFDAALLVGAGLYLLALACVRRLAAA